MLSVLHTGIVGKLSLLFALLNTAHFGQLELHRQYAHYSNFREYILQKKTEIVAW